MKTIAARTENLQLFLDNLDPDVYQTDFATEGSSNYAFTLVLREPDAALCRARHGIACERTASSSAAAPPAAATSCGSPTCADRSAPTPGRRYPHADHVHFYGFYIGNYPTLEQDKILRLCELLTTGCGNDQAAANAS